MLCKSLLCFPILIFQLFCCTLQCTVDRSVYDRLELANDEEWTECYDLGKEASKESENCTLLHYYTSKCKEAFRKGCIDEKLPLYCKRGKHSALQNLPCVGLQEKEPLLFTEFKNCCRNCKRAVKAYKTGTNGIPMKDKTFYECYHHASNEVVGSKLTTDNKQIETQIDFKPCPICPPISGPGPICPPICGPGPSRPPITGPCPNGPPITGPCPSRPLSEPPHSPPPRPHLPTAFGNYNPLSDQSEAAKRQVCPDGYQLNAKNHCEDIDECKLHSTVCAQNEVCLNYNGTYSCVKNCIRGLERNQQGVCVDINECTTKKHNCDAVSTTCLNHNGSFECVCRKGFKLSKENSSVCDDIDECKDEFSCPILTPCRNRVGGYDCILSECITGYTLDRYGQCVDIDECEESENPCPEMTECVNTSGSFKCISNEE